MTKTNRPYNDELREIIGLAIFGAKYFDYILAKPTDPPSKYPYPGAIAKLDDVMEYVDNNITHQLEQSTRELQTKVKAQEMFTHKAIELAKINGRIIQAEATLDKWNNFDQSAEFRFGTFLQGQVDAYKYEISELNKQKEELR